jgi:hypothetical protein
MNYGEEGKRTVTDDKKINAQNGKSFTNAVVRVLEFTLHDGGVDFNEDNSSKTSEDHPNSRLD